jgi:hypothetical protein
MSQRELAEIQTNAVATVEKIDNGKPALYNPAAFDQLYRAANLFASSDLVPASYKGKPANCFIAIEMADRMGISPFAVLQSLVIIQGKPSMEAKLIIALVNDSGIFEDPLEYEIEGEDPYAMDYRVRCFAVMKKTGKKCLGPWIDYRMVKGEGWLSKGGSKWLTMPSIMFMYRAASFFAKVYAPNITMGMQTQEEMEDVRGPVQINPIPQQNLANTRHVEQVGYQPENDKPLFGTVVEHEGQTVGSGEVVTATRERGKPAPGKQRRTAAELAEDKAADERDAAAAKPADTPTTAAEVVDPTCDHPDEVSFMEDGVLMCGKCGCPVPEEAPAVTPAATVQPATTQAAVIRNVDLF